MIDNPPPAPDAIPQYIVDGMHRQDTPSLEAIEQYARDLQATLEEQDAQPIDEDALGNESEHVTKVGEKDGWTYVEKKLDCGKNCKGCPHGPYMYRVNREDGELVWDYPKDHPMNNKKKSD